MPASTVVDYVVVGGGSAGCVPAARLSEDPAANVLLLEAGGDSNPISDTPGLLLSIMQHGWFYWPYQTEPQQHLENRQFFFSGASRYGVGPSDFTAAAGRRSSTGRAYLHGARRRPNLIISTRSVAQRIIVEKGRATGLEYTKGARMHKVSAREVIVSAGAINSPKFLMLSGIGDPNILSRLDIPIAMAVPGVGKNLQDHLAVSVSYRCTQPITLFNHLRPTAMVKAGLQYLLCRSGPLSVPAYEVIAYMRSSVRESSPDLKFTLALALFGSFGRDINTDPGFSVYVEHLRPQSTGSIHLRSRDPSEPPLIHPNFLAAQAD